MAIMGRKSKNIEDRRKMRVYRFNTPTGPRSVSVDPVRLKNRQYGPQTLANVARAVLEDKAAVERYRRAATIMYGYPFREEQLRRKTSGGWTHHPDEMPYIPRAGVNAPIGKKPFTPLTDVGMTTRFKK